MYHVGGVEMNFPIMVGAGACKTPSSILPYMRKDVPVGAVSTGSYTPEPRTGNEGTLFWPTNVSELMQKGVGLNSFGMPNMGNERAAAELSRYSCVHPVIASIAGFSADDFVAGVRAFQNVPCVSAIKLNAGCPNVHDMKSVPIAYDPDSLLQVLEAIKRFGPEKPIWLKLSPYITAWQRAVLQTLHSSIDFSHVPFVEPKFLREIVDIAREYEFIRAIVFSNTLPNVIIRDASGNPVTTPNGGQAGLSGKILKEISIDLIRQARTMLSDDVDLILSGGMLHGDDAADGLEDGASAVFCTSGPFWSGSGSRFFATMVSGSERLQNHLMRHIATSRDDAVENAIAT